MHDFILCPYCGEILDEETVCPTCGKDLLNVILDVECPLCGFKNPSENKKCWYCEYDLEYAKKRDWLWKNDKELIFQNLKYKKVSLAMFIAFCSLLVSSFTSYVSFAYNWNILFISNIFIIISLTASVIFGIIRYKLGNLIDMLFKGKIQSIIDEEESNE